MWPDWDAVWLLVRIAFWAGVILLLLALLSGNSMRLLRRQITSPRVDAVVMLLVAWALMDMGGVAYATNTTFGVALGLAAIASLLIAWRAWRRKPTGSQSLDA